MMILLGGEKMSDEKMELLKMLSKSSILVHKKKNKK